MSSTSSGGRHLDTVAPVRLVPSASRYTPRGRAGLIAVPAVLSRHSATASTLGAAAALAGSSAAAIALMLGLGR
jgi:2-keto-3-deoxy-L-rhamnonate aldolase RhmA